VGIGGLACGVRRGVGGMRGVCDRRTEERRMHSRVGARWRVGVGTTDGLLCKRWELLIVFDAIRRSGMRHFHVCQADLRLWHAQEVYLFRHLYSTRKTRLSHVAS
jgi:hypothetical protein